MRQALQEHQNGSKPAINATRAVVSTFGTIAALAGLEHGIGEILQGNIAPADRVFLSWRNSAFFEALGGEPAMSLVPNLLASGILTIIVSSIFLAWAALFVQQKNSALVLMLLSVLLLLVGGGFGPPLLGLILAATATRINAPIHRGHTRLWAEAQDVLSRMWSWLFAAAVVAWLLLLPGLPILGYYFGVSNTSLVLTVTACAFGFLLLTILAAFAHDASRADAPRAPAPSS